MSLRFLISLVFMAASAGVSAQVYKSVDASGRVVYSDRPQDSTVQVSVIKAAVNVPLYRLPDQPAPERKPAMVNVAVLAAASEPRSPLSASALNARGEVCARLAVEKAKAVRTSFAVAAR